MQIVIDIDENLYTRLFDNGVDNYDDAVDMAKAIRKGTPLPKGHGRLIDESKIEVCEWVDVLEEGYPKASTDAPTIIEADEEDKDD